MDWIGGITNSCDVYFYRQGLRTGGALIEATAKRFGLGRRTGIRLPGERQGNMFGPQARRARKRGWYDGDTVNLSIGQGELLATPLQMAVVIAAVANRGTLWRPQFTRELRTPDGRVSRRFKPEAVGRVELSSKTWNLIHEGLLSVVRNGTGRRLNIPGLSVAGKTGTSQNPRGKDHAWFVAFAGREGEEPALAVAVVVEHGGHGSSAAGPIAKRAIEAAFDIASAKRPRRRESAPVPARESAAQAGVGESSGRSPAPAEVVKSTEVRAEPAPAEVVKSTEVRAEPAPAAVSPREETVPVQAEDMETPNFPAEQ